MGENAIFMLTAVAALLSESAEKDHAFLDTEAQLYIKINNALNKRFEEWNEVFPSAACITTMLDRLLHHAEVTVIEGSSYRVRESEQEATARRRRKR